MIPTLDQAKALWDKYELPEKKRIHVTLVAKLAAAFADQLTINKLTVQKDLLVAAALLHDIDKAIPKAEGETHPDTAVRVLREEGMGEVADIVATHSLHAILDPAIAPNTWEQRLLYLADKMVKQEIVGVDGRFDLWRAEDLPAGARVALEKTYPLVKKLEREVCDLIGVSIDDIVRLTREETP